MDWRRCIGKKASKKERKKERKNEKKKEKNLEECACIEWNERQLKNILTNKKGREKMIIIIIFNFDLLYFP